MIDGAYRVSVPAVKRPCLTKYFWNSAGSTPSLSAFGGILRRSAEHLGELAIEVDQLLGDGLAFVRIGVQDLRRAPPAEDRRQLPSQIEAVLHGDVHALPCFRAVRMAGVAGNEHAREAVLRLLFRHVVELVAKPLADLVDRPPRDLLHLQRVGMQYPLRRGDQMIGRDVPARDPLILVELVELDIQADEIAAFPGNDQHAAFVGRLDRRLQADVGEVGDGQHIHDAPGLVGRIPVQRPPEGLAHGAARAVATDDEAGLHGFHLPFVRGIEPFEPDGHRVGRSVPSPSPEWRGDREIEQAARIVRLQPRRRIAHDIQIEIMHPRLVQDHMREFGQPVFGILDSAAADDVARAGCRRASRTTSR